MLTIPKKLRGHELGLLGKRYTSFFHTSPPLPFTVSKTERPEMIMLFRDQILSCLFIRRYLRRIKYQGGMTSVEDILRDPELLGLLFIVCFQRKEGGSRPKY